VASGDEAGAVRVEAGRRHRVAVGGKRPKAAPASHIPKFDIFVKRASDEDAEEGREIDAENVR